MVGLLALSPATIISALLVLNGAFASPSPNPSGIISSLTGSTLPQLEKTLASRQSTFDPSVIPSQCQAKCQVVTDISNCTTESCICSNSVADNLASCYDCIIAADKSETQAEGQAAMDAYTSACAAVGVTVKKETISANTGYQVRAGVLGMAAAAVTVALIA